MSDSGLTSFETAIGACGIAWRPDGLVGLQLPGGREGVDRLRRRFPDLAQGTPPPWVEEAIAAIRSLLSGQAADLGFVPLDFSGLAEFDAAVLRAARAIPPGRTVTYGAIAAQLGEPKAAQAVGRALGRNPWPIVVPCHRVTGAGGRTGGFSAPGGTATKLKLLEIEGALAAETLPLFAERD
jgi:methylated-DNA-[protein]-cysteine S-methyltransferase